jgi:hypothetical protein
VVVVVVVGGGRGRLATVGVDEVVERLHLRVRVPVPAAPAASGPPARRRPPGAPARRNSFAPLPRPRPLRDCDAASGCDTGESGGGGGPGGGEEDGDGRELCEGEAAVVVHVAAAENHGGDGGLLCG